MKLVRAKKAIWIIIICLMAIGGVVYNLNRSIKKIDKSMAIIHVYNYESSDHKFKDIEVPEKGRTLEMVESAFEDYKKENGLDDVELRITTKMTSADDKNHRRWKYEYMKSIDEKNDN
ncbi:hypothetical protein [Anaeromicrobium sediminis]|uniref:Uncharacterized protein n=1 Tax=Anaeromicrobium sediminis TaxID=1478221 RepID=A0A267MDC5_9FIRM|nr:hypothetical protein [Anaeromicrobium sediminis]PAB57382.1 hypothetical protein CCE28_18980 [Anaeromicrobium sediminis]